MYPPRRQEPLRRGLAACLRALAALLGLAGASLAQFGTVQREQKIASASGNFAGVLGNDYRFGVSVAELGDFDGDGVRDLVVGAHRANIGGPERGAVYLLFLNPDGTVKAYREISSRSAGFVDPIEDNDRFGISVCSLGDLDLDGTTDVAVGAYRDDDGGTDFGAVYLLFLRPDGSIKLQRKISALAGGFAGELGLEDSFGWSVETIGDLDGDGVIDLAVGATRDDGEDSDPTLDFGALYLLFLDADGSVRTHARIGSGPGGLGAVLRIRDRFGADVALLGDADGDGVEDIAVGAFGDDPQKYGKVFVVRLRADGAVKSFQEIGYGTGGFTGLLGKGDRFGISLAADDLDGDGLSDLLVGAAGDDDGGANAGALWVCLLDSLGRVRSSEKISSDFGGFGGFLHPSDEFGVSCATLGDIDRDGAVDLAVGAYQDDEGGYDRGATWVLFRAPGGAPVADFASTPGSGTTPLLVSFTDRSSGQVTGWRWDFGDGAIALEASPAHTYTTPGAFDVELAVSGPLGGDALLRQRAVVAQAPVAPSADFSATPGTGPVPLTVTFLDLSTGDVTAWAWGFGDGTGSSLRNVKHSYAVIGTYTVSLTVRGPTGTSTKTVADQVSVLEELPVASFSADPTVGLAPLEVAFTDLSSANATSWSWDFGDGATSLERSPVHVYALAGLYAVALTVTGASGSDTLARPGLIAVDGARFSYVNPGGVAPVSVQFTDESRGGISAWSWSFGDGTSSTLQSPAHTYREGGAFLATLTIQGPGLSASASATVEIGEPVPVARFSVSTTAGPAPLEVRFTDRSTGNITGWLWDFGDGTPYATQQHPVHVYGRPGAFTVRLKVTSAGGTDVERRDDFIRASNPFLPRPIGDRRSGAPSNGGTVKGP